MRRNHADRAMNVLALCVQRRHGDMICVWLSYWECFSLRHDGIMRGALSFAVKALVRFEAEWYMGVVIGPIIE